MPHDNRAGPYTISPTPPARKPPPAPADQIGGAPAAAAETTAAPDAAGLAEIMRKLTQMQTTQSTLATKEDFKGLATKEDVTVEGEAAKA